MSRLYTLILTIGLCGLYSCVGQQGILDDYVLTYDIGKIPGVESFMQLNKEEIQMDERYPIEDTLTSRGAFRKNRSRIFLDAIKNGEIQKKDSVYFTGLSTRCFCHTKTDTTFITMGLGYFGGFGFSIRIYQDKFESDFFEYIDDVKPYKTDLNDTAFYDQIRVDNKYQSLILDTKPIHEKGQQITGLLTYTTNEYYIRKYSNDLDTLYVTGKIYFTCKTSEKQ